MNKFNLFETKLSFMDFLLTISLLGLVIYFLIINSDLFYPILLAFLFDLTWTKKFRMDSENIIISYPFIPFVKKVFFLGKINKIAFKSNNAAASPRVLIIWLENGRKSRNYFSGGKEFQELIDLLRNRGINVEVISHIWN